VNASEKNRHAAARRKKTCGSYLITGETIMTIFAELLLTPGGVIAWIVVGLLAGWLAGTVMSGGGYGIIRDTVLGLVGALIGGFVSGFFIQGAAGFWGSLLVAFIGACILVAIVRAFSPGHARRM
jgi:uncharacterized membrane protein YeaQ/YmgE (transglycosylase-associated protein family)